MTGDRTGATTGMVSEPTELKVVHHPDGDEMDAYERLLGYAMAGDGTLFARQDGVEAAWTIVEPILGNATPVNEYAPGTWGPPRRSPADGGGWWLALPAVLRMTEMRRWVMAKYVGEVSMWRVTLTPPVINAAAEVIFLLSGGNKAGMLCRVLEGPYQPETLPAQAIAPHSGQLRWLADAPAAWCFRRCTSPRQPNSSAPC